MRGRDQRYIANIGGSGRGGRRRLEILTFPMTTYRRGRKETGRENKNS